MRFTCEYVEVERFFGEGLESIDIADDVGPDAFAAGIFLHVVKLYISTLIYHNVILKNLVIDHHSLPLLQQLQSQLPLRPLNP